MLVMTLVLPHPICIPGEGYLQELDIIQVGVGQEET